MDDTKALIDLSSPVGNTFINSSIRKNLDLEWWESVTPNVLDITQSERHISTTFKAIAKGEGSFDQQDIIRLRDATTLSKDIDLKQIVTNTGNQSKTSFSDDCLISKVAESDLCTKATSTWEASNEAASFTELHLRLARAESCRDELARQQGQFKAEIAKLAGSVSAGERRMAAQATEITNLKARCVAMESELANAQSLLRVTPERCKEAQTTLAGDAARSQEAVRVWSKQVAKLEELLQKEASEVQEMCTYASHERQLANEVAAEVAQALAEARTEAEVQRQVATAVTAQLAEAHLAVEDLENRLTQCTQELLYSKEQLLEMEAESNALRERSVAASSAAAQARAAAEALEQLQIETEKRAQEAEKTITSLYKQVRAMTLAIDRHPSLAATSPDVMATVRALHDWVATHQRLGDPSSS